jgi:hypothetical protein
MLFPFTYFMNSLSNLVLTISFDSKHAIVPILKIIKYSNTQIQRDNNNMLINLSFMLIDMRGH